MTSGMPAQGKWPEELTYLIDFLTPEVDRHEKAFPMDRGPPKVRSMRSPTHHLSGEVVVAEEVWQALHRLWKDFPQNILQVPARGAVPGRIVTFADQPRIVRGAGTESQMVEIHLIDHGPVPIAGAQDSADQ